jgi:hypothetical protein
MKKVRLGLLFAGIGLFASSCIKDDEVKFTGSVVEFDAAVMNTNNAYMLPPDSIAFPILTRMPAIGRAVNTGDAMLTRTTTAPVSLRVNLVGAQRKQATTVNYRTVNMNEYKLLGVASNLNEQAQPGTHYTALSGTLTIPADSSFGYINVPLMNSGVSSTTPREIVLMLTGGTDVTPSRNYKVVGLRVSQ